MFDSKTNEVVKASFASLRRKSIRLLSTFIEVTLLLNFAVSFSFVPFPKREIQTVGDYFFWGNLLNNFTLAYLAGNFLESGTLAFSIAISLITGFETIILNNNPLTRSTSIADFWGRRWNQLVGTNLRVSFAT